MTAILPRLNWVGTAEKQAETIRLHKGGRTAVCELWSHQFGWELRLEAAGEMLRTQVCRSQDEVLSTTEAWRAALEKRGWGWVPDGAESSGRTA